MTCFAVRSLIFPKNARIIGKAVSVFGLGTQCLLPECLRDEMSTGLYIVKINYIWNIKSVNNLI